MPAAPAWGQTLEPGYCGFITREADIVGDGIEYFEHWDGGLPFVHAFIVSGPNEVIEAHAVKGVSRAPLDQYLGQKDCQCFIRIPAGYTPDIGAKIVAAAASHLGEKYGYAVIIDDALANTFLGHWFNKITDDAPDKFMHWLLNNAHAKICSQLVALALQSLAYLRMRGCLVMDAAMVMPKPLGNDVQVFGSLTYKIS